MLHGLEHDADFLFGLAVEANMLSDNSAQAMKQIGRVLIVVKEVGGGNACIAKTFIVVVES